MLTPAVVLLPPRDSDLDDSGEGGGAVPALRPWRRQQGGGLRIILLLLLARLGAAPDADEAALRREADEGRSARCANATSNLWYATAASTQCIESDPDSGSKKCACLKKKLVLLACQSLEAAHISASDLDSRQKQTNDSSPDCDSPS